MVFAHLLFLSQDRGPHATGVVWLKRDGTHRILKQPGKTLDFIRCPAFSDFMAGINASVTWLAGHARWQTVGDASNNRNNHPIRAGQIIGTHNGTITNADYLFSHFNLARRAEVDSEIIFRLADATLANGCIDVMAFKKRLALCKGEVSAVMASLLNPQEVVIIKGDRPLEVRYNKDRQLVIYSSDAKYLDAALAGDKQWKPINLRPMTITRFSCFNMRSVKYTPFKLATG